MKLTEHFELSEFACNCGCGIEAEFVPEMTALAEYLEVLRLAVGKPLVILSGIRCELHNTAIGGAEHSNHLALPDHAKAADVTCPGTSSEILYKNAQTIFPCALWYKGRHFVHCDLRQEPLYYVLNPDGSKLFA